MVDTMNKMANKWVALFLSLVLMVSTISPILLNVTATVGEKATKSSIESTADLTYIKSNNAEIIYDSSDTLYGNKENWIYTTVKTALPSIVMKPVLENDNNTIYFAVTDGDIITNDAIDLSKTKGLALKLTKNGTSLDISYYKKDSNQFVSYASVANYKFDTVNTFSWARNGFAWRLSVNSKTLATTEDIGFSSCIFEIGSKTTFTFFGMENDFEFEEVKLNGNISESFTGTNASGSNQITVNGNEKDGYSVKGNSILAAYNKPFNFENTEISFKSTDLAASGKWGGFVISNSYGGKTYYNGTSLNPSNLNAGDGNSIAVFFHNRNLNALVTSNGTTTSYNLGTIENFDFDAVHKIGFVKEASSKWFICIDGEKRAEVTNWVSALEGKDVFYTFMSSNIQFTDIKMKESTGIYKTAANISIAGDEINGYSFSDSTNNGTFAMYTTPININTQGIQFKNECSSSNSPYLILTNTKQLCKSMSPNSSNNPNGTVYFRFVKSGTTFMIRSLSYNGSNVVDKLYGKWNGFDFTKPHIYQFVRNSENDWDILIDGKLPATATGNDLTNQIAAKEAMGPALEKLAKGKTYAQFSQQSDKLNFANVKRVAFVTWNQSKITQTGNATDGYTINGAAGDTVQNRATLIQPFNINTQTLTFKRDSYDSWGNLIRFSTSAAPLANLYGDKNEQTNYNFVNLFIKGNTTNKEFELRALYQGYKSDDTSITLIDTLIGKIADFDWTVPHTIGFVKNRDGNWAVTVDGAQPDTFDYSAYKELKTKDSLQTNLNKQLDALSSANKVYVGFVANNKAAIDFSQIKINTLLFNISW